MDFDEFAAMQELAGSMQGLPEAFAESDAFRKFMVNLLMGHERRLAGLLDERLRPLMDKLDSIEP